MPERTGWPITDGTSQTSRYPAALAEGFIRVDEMTAEDLLAFIADFASSLRFYNLDHEPDGTWADLLADDEAVVMARIMSVDLHRLELECRRRIASAPTELALYASQLARTLDSWLRQLKRGGHDAGQALSWKIAEMIERQLSEELHGLGEWVARTNPREGFPIDFAEFDPVWRVQVTPAGCAFPKSRLPRGAPADDEQRILRTILSEFVHGISYLKTIVPEYLQRSLHSQNHRPAVGLILAFVRLFRHAQEGLNTFTGRHVDFYYHRVLRAQPRPLSPDRAYLLLEKDDAAPDLMVPRGTAFAAGKDADQKERVYLADHDLVVTKAKVTACCTLHLERDPLISPEHELRYLTRAKATVLEIEEPRLERGCHRAWPLFGAGSAKAMGTTDAEFGLAIASPMFLLREGTRTIRLGLHLLDPADIDDNAASLFQQLREHDAVVMDGLCRLVARLLRVESDTIAAWGCHSADELASRLVTTLSQEERRAVVQADSLGVCVNRVLLYLVQHAPTQEAFSTAFGRLLRRQLLFQPGWPSEDERRLLSETARQRLSDVSAAVVQQLLQRDGMALFYDMLRQAFIIDMTAASGWHPVRDYRVEPLIDDGTGRRQGMQCRFVLNPDVAPILSYAPDIHGHRLKTRHPVLRLRVNPHSHVYGYSIFTGLILHRVAIDVSVDGIRSVVAFNEYGRVDPTKPFNPFGVSPAPGSSWMFGNYEMAQKPLVSVTADIEWGELPRHPDGFRGHYRGYETPPSTESFKVETLVLRHGQWLPDRAKHRTRQSLFATEPGSDRISPTSSVTIDAKPYAVPIHPDTTEEAFAAATHIGSGYFKIVIAEPDGAFGHAAYPVLLSRTLAENATLKKPRPVPNPPYTPLITRLTLRYEARTILPVSLESPREQAETRDHVVHLHPFGLECIHPVSRHAAYPVIPEYREEGQLFLGIQADRLSGVLTVFFSLTPASTVDRPSEPSRPTWWYLVDNTWRPLAPSRILSDTTEGLLTSGVITLDIPSDIDRTGTILPEDRFWLKISVRSNAHAYGMVQAVHTHGLRVTWRSREGARSHLEHQLPAGTIRQTLVPIAGLRRVIQIEPSFGGRAPEDSHRLRMRLSERLRHKHRAATPWDYERLVLDQFPNVSKAKCFPTRSRDRDSDQPGTVLIVVVPTVGDPDRATVFTPSFTAQELIRMRETLRKLASPWVRIEVCNPVYEWIQVRCAVKLTKDAQGGSLLKRLNEMVRAYISPWQEGGYQARFGWRMRREDIETVLRSIDGVEYVTKFSLLHITRDRHGRYRLRDTARRHDSEPGALAESSSIHVDNEEITPMHPWSLAVPMPDHVIVPLERLTSLRPEPVGIEDLEIERTFIL